MRIAAMTVQVLALGFNQISSVASLQLGWLAGLRSLFLQGNEITRIDGLAGLENLQVRYYVYGCACLFKLARWEVQTNKRKDRCTLFHAHSVPRTLCATHNLCHQLLWTCWLSPAARQELVLDRNRIRYVDPDAFAGLPRLRELRLEENGLRSLAGLAPLAASLQVGWQTHRVAALTIVLYVF